MQTTVVRSIDGVGKDPPQSTHTRLTSQGLRSLSLIMKSAPYSSKEFCGRTVLAKLGLSNCTRTSIQELQWTSAPVSVYILYTITKTSG